MAKKAILVQYNARVKHARGGIGQINCMENAYLFIQAYIKQDVE